MRWYILSIVVLLALALAESSLLPIALGGGIRPNLILIVSAVVAAQSGSNGFALALGGGLMLDLMSSVPLGLSSLSFLIDHSGTGPYRMCFFRRLHSSFERVSVRAPR